MLWAVMTPHVGQNERLWKSGYQEGKAPFLENKQQMVLLYPLCKPGELQTDMGTI